jgi:ABC-type nitrate/sulfonate/bicarbonate transport system substrate-binding protein
MSKIMKRSLSRFTIISAAIITISLLIIGSFIYPSSPGNYTGQVESVTIGVDPSIVNLLVYVAENKSYLSANGLNVTLKDYASGTHAVEGMLKNEVDVALSTEFTVARNALSNQNVQTFASINKFSHIFVIGNRDSGIQNVSDLAGKKVGLSLQTISDFYLSRFLDLNGVNRTQVSLVNVSPSQTVDFLVNGTVDAVVAWQPWVGAIETQMGDRIVMWDAHSGQFAYDCAISTNNWISSNPEAVKRLIKSLVQAEEYTINYPSETQLIIQNRLKYTAAFVNAVWSQYRFSVSLDQSLVVAMQDESRWLIENKITNATAIHNFLNYVYSEALESIRPQSVNLVK